MRRATVLPCAREPLESRRPARRRSRVEAGPELRCDVAVEIRSRGRLLRAHLRVSEGRTGGRSDGRSRALDSGAAPAEVLVRPRRRSLQSDWSSTRTSRQQASRSKVKTTWWSVSAAESVTSTRSGERARSFIEKPARARDAALGNTGNSTLSEGTCTSTVAGSGLALVSRRSMVSGDRVNARWSSVLSPKAPRNRSRFLDGQTTAAEATRPRRSCPRASPRASNAASPKAARNEPRGQERRPHHRSRGTPEPRRANMGVPCCAGSVGV